MARSTTDRKITFDVDNVRPASSALPEVAYKDAIIALLQRHASSLESWSQSAVPLIAVSRQAAGVHPFLLTVNRTYAEHRPLILSPDMIWLLILQGVALHINADAGRGTLLSALSP